MNRRAMWAVMGVLLVGVLLVGVLLVGVLLDPPVSAEVPG